MTTPPTSSRPTPIATALPSIEVPVAASAAVVARFVDDAASAITVAGAEVDADTGDAVAALPVPFRQPVPGATAKPAHSPDSKSGLRRTKAPRVGATPLPEDQSPTRVIPFG